MNLEIHNRRTMIKFNSESLDGMEVKNKLFEL